MHAFLRPVTWATANMAVATVSSLGVVTAVGAGTTTITATSGGRTASATVSVPTPGGLVAVGAGNARTCALTAAGNALCRGVPVAGTPGGSVPSAIAGGLHFVQLAIGADFACGRASANASWCWGAGDFGQLGNGQATSAIAPQLVQGGLTFASLTAGDDHACGLTATGAAWCWGADSLGQLGRNGTGGSNVPVAVSGSHVFASLSAGPRHSWNAVSAGFWKTCALTTAGTAYCWGANSFGQVGNGTWGAAVLAPAAVVGGRTFTTISAGAYNYSDEAINGGTAAHSCGVTTGGVTYCWGVNNTGQLGIGSTGFQAVTVPVKVAGQP